jgi:hypothetical protein
MNATLNGKWSYLSFRHDPIVLKDGKVEGDPELAARWSPPAELDAATGADGRVTGTLTFKVKGGVALAVSGEIVAATAGCPASVSLTGEGHGSVNKLKGHFIPGSDHVVGTVVCTQHDLLGQPDGTAGPFVLVPLKT